MSDLAACPVCAGRALHDLPNMDGSDPRRASECSSCNWVRWPDDSVGCDHCRLHWNPRRKDRHGYIVPRAAVLLGADSKSVEALLAEAWSLRRNELTAIPILHRIPIHALWALLDGAEPEAERTALTLFKGWVSLALTTETGQGRG